MSTLETVRKTLYQPNMEKALAAVLPKTANMDRWLALAWQASKTLKDKPNLDANSVLVSIYEGAKLGLELNPTLGEAYLVPFNCRVKVRGQDEWRTICTFIPGYRGLIKLARRAGIKDIQGRVVMSNDEFDYYLDENGPHMMFRPVARDRGTPLWVISRAILPDGTYSIMDPLPWDKVEQIKQQTLKRSKGTGPWTTHEEEMGIKTGIRRHCKVLPQETILAEALHLDEQAEELGKPQTQIDPALDNIIDGEYREMLEETEREEITGEGSKPRLASPKPKGRKKAQETTRPAQAEKPNPLPDDMPPARPGLVWIDPASGREWHCGPDSAWMDSGIRHDPGPKTERPTRDEQEFAKQQAEPEEPPESAQEPEDEADDHEDATEAEPVTQQPPAAREVKPEAAPSPGLYAGEILRLATKMGWSGERINQEAKEKFGADNFMTVPAPTKLSVLKHFRSLAGQ